MRGRRGRIIQTRPGAGLQPRFLRARSPAPMPDHRARAGCAPQGAVRAHPVGLADHRQLRFPDPRRFRPHPRGHQAAQRRVLVAQPAYGHRGSAADARLDHPAHRGGVRARRLHRRQGTARPARGDPGHPRGARSPRDPPRAGAARRDGRPRLARRGVGAEESRAGPGEPLRRRPHLRPAADVQPARRPRAFGLDTAQDHLHGLSQECASRQPAADAGHDHPVRALHPRDPRRGR